MKTKLLLAAAVAALSIGATGAQAVTPAVTATDIVTQSTDSAVVPAHHRWHLYFYGYYYPYYYPYYYYRPYYYFYGYYY